MARWLPALLLGTLWCSDALARVGGGDSFGGAGGGSGGGWSGGGGGDGGGLILYLILRLAIEYPAVGVPLILVGGVAVWHMHRTGTLEAMVVEGRAHGGPSRHAPSAAPPVRRQATDAAWQALLDDDPGLSLPVVEDRVQLVLRRAHELVGDPERQVPGGAVTLQAREALRSFDDGVEGIQDVVLASSQLLAVRRAGGYDTLTFRVTLSRRETRTADRQVHAFCEETWTFRRAIGAPSRDPESVHRLGCPACGSPEQTDVHGDCPACGTAVGNGELAWQANEMNRTVRRTYAPQPTARGAVTEEPGYRMATARHPELASQLRAFQGRHPDANLDAIEARVRDIFHSLQAAWSAGAWADARPYCTDTGWSALRYGIVQHDVAGIRNRVEDVEIHKVEVVRITLDAWYEALTVRFAARAHDWYEDRATGAVVSGSPDTPRAFAEYWTFLRAVQADQPPTDPRRCPSCGAPVDRVDHDGVCGYCDSVITTGRYDWVLSRIEQPEVFTP